MNQITVKLQVQNTDIQSIDIHDFDITKYTLTICSYPSTLINDLSLKT